MGARPRKACRLCGRGDLSQVLSLPPTPPANAFLRERTEQELYPLDVNMCGGCQHVQLSTVVDPEELFRNYVYVSSTSDAFQLHFRKYARMCMDRFDLREGSLVVEIGSNDGILLRHFLNAGLPVVGVEPATEIARRANLRGIFTIPHFFRASVGRDIRSVYGPAKLVCANNVFAHIDDLVDATRGVNEMLAEYGVFVFEVQWLAKQMEHNYFDNFYHEHLSYHTLKSLIPFFDYEGLEIFDAHEVNTHGGSLRIFAKRAGNRLYHPLTSEIDRLIDIEDQLGLTDPQQWERWGARIQSKRDELRAFLTACMQTAWANDEDIRIAGYGAPAKMTTLMYTFGLTDNDIDVIADDSSWKHGTYSPGLHVPIVSLADMLARNPDVVVVFAWNYAGVLVSKLRAHGYQGTVVVPLPELVEHRRVH